MKQKPQSSSRIAVDMSSGASPLATRLLACAKFSQQASLSLVGDSVALKDTAESIGLDLSPFQIVHTTTQITGEESLRDVLRIGQQSSLAYCLRMVAEAEVDGMVTSGDTRALVALSRHFLGTFADLRRPAIIKPFEGDRGAFHVLDLGANVEVSARLLYQFAHLGCEVAALSEHVTTKPRVALLNIGTESGKGPDVLRRTSAMLAGTEHIDFAGFVEPNDIFSGRADVVACNGYTGNLLLKSFEGAATFLSRRFAKLAELHAALEHPLVAAVAADFNTERYNGALLAGVRGLVVKSHGSTGTTGFASAIEQTLYYLRANIVAKLDLALQRSSVAWSKSAVSRDLAE